MPKHEGIPIAKVKKLNEEKYKDYLLYGGILLIILGLLGNLLLVLGICGIGGYLYLKFRKKKEIEAKDE